MILTSVDVREIIVGTNLVQIVLNVLNDSRCSIFNKIVHCVQRFENLFPFFRLRLYFRPEVLHNYVVVLPIVGVVS